jgi:hypothetical protein
MMNEYIHCEEDQLIWEFFKCSEDGFFIEVGAGDPVNLSVSYHLEVKGWKGLLVEPQPELATKLKNNRKAKVCSVACGSPQDRDEADFFVAGEFSSGAFLRQCLNSKINYTTSCHLIKIKN